MKRKLKLLKFESDTCAPCKTMNTLLNGFKMCPVETYSLQKDLEMFDEYTIRMVPTLIIEDEEGNELWRRTGSVSKHYLDSIVKSLQ